MKNNVSVSNEKQDFLFLTVLGTLVYFVSYVSRINLSAAMVEVVRIDFAPRNIVALALSVSSVTYGAGQILSGFLGDRFRPQNVIFVGFLCTAAMNLSVSALQDYRFLVVLWGVNGLAQAFMWPPLLAILVRFVRGKRYSRACLWVSWGGAFGTMAVYVFCPLILRFMNFRFIFLFSGLMAVVMSVVWKVLFDRRFGHRDSSANLPQSPAAAKDVHPVTERFTGGAAILMGLIMLGIVLQGMLRDGVTNWMPTLVLETFNLDSSSAIFTGILLPVFHIASLKIASLVYERLIRNELLCSGVIFAVGLLSAALLSLLPRNSVLITSLLIALLVGSMHGVNYVLLCMVPKRFERFGHVSLISGALNSSTYIGSAVSTYGIAVISERYGWNLTITLWMLIAIAGTTLCLLLARRWKQFTA